MQLRAPLLYTATGQVLRDQAVGVAGDAIRYILPMAEAPADPEVVDLPQTALLPGFVNAHCHLDLSHMSGEFEFRGSFSGWIRELMSRRLLPNADAMRTAAEALMRSGVTTVYDHVGPWSDISSVLDLPLRYRFFVEVSGVTLEEATRRREMAEDLVLRLRREGFEASPTPHAPYSLHPEIFKKLVGNGAVSLHYAESTEEQEFFARGSGKMAEFLQELGATESTSLQPSFPKNSFAIHCNTVTDDEIALLKSTRATVVHCPRSHRYFNHPPFPLEKLRAAGIPIAIGTDSLASCPNFDFLEELRTLREEFPVLKTEEILGMASHSEFPLTPALSQGRGGFANIIGLPLQNDILQGPVTFSMIGGRRVI